MFCACKANGNNVNINVAFGLLVCSYDEDIFHFPGLTLGSISNLSVCFMFFTMNENINQFLFCGRAIIVMIYLGSVTSI